MANKYEIMTVPGSDVIAGSQKSIKIVKRMAFTAEIHLRVQAQIEQRAHTLWCAGGCQHNNALNDWLQAEREILREFIQSHANRHLLPKSLRLRISGGATRSKPQHRLLEPGRSIVATRQQTTSAPAVFH
jgi:hypothetical protein